MERSDSTMSKCGKSGEVAQCGFIADNAGTTAIEYGLLGALIVVACLVAFSAFGASLVNLYQFWIVPAVAAL